MRDRRRHPTRDRHSHPTSSVRKFRVAVPPGVGDVYWCLTKLKPLREAVGADHVELCVQKAGPGRSVDWAKMVDFVDSASFFPFRPGEAARTGRGRVPGVDIVLWPNAIVDAGRHLSEWLPEYPLDLDFPIHTEPMGPPRVLVYASSVAINRAWLPTRGVSYWVDLIRHLAVEVGPVTLIGAGWDKDFSDEIAVSARGSYEDFVGQTTLPQVADLLKHADILVGVISGMTILANHFRTPCIAIHPDAHHPDFPRTWVADDAPYLPIRDSIAPPAAELARMAASLTRSTTRPRPAGQRIAPGPVEGIVRAVPSIHGLVDPGARAANEGGEA